MQDPHVCSVVWSQSPDAATRRMALPATAFCVELCRGIQGRLGDIESTGRRVTFPLTQQLAQTFNPHPRVVLVGDAGRVLHPLAGLGANLGLEDVRELLAGAGRIPAGGDVGAAGLWRTYDRQRSARSQLLLAVMGGLRRIYGRGDPLTQWLRNAGVHWLNAAGPVKRQIMTEAMGLGPVGRGPHQQPGSRDMGHGT
jgi:2-octaprenylphenol hydroxylase